jgi:hypothetical protein
VLIVGGHGEGGADPTVELLEPDGRSSDLGIAGGRGARLGGGAVALVGGVGVGSTGVSWLAAPGETVALADLPLPRTGHTVTALEDGAFLVAGGDNQSLVVYSARGAPTVLAPFSRTGHTATRLGDGSVLLAGGGPDGVGSTDAFVYLRSPVGPFATLPSLTFDSADAGGVMARRPDHAVVVDGRLRLTAGSAGSDGPTEWALAPGLVVGDFTLDMFAGHLGAAEGALLFGWQSSGSYAFIRLAAGQPVTLATVGVEQAGQLKVAPVDGC